MRESPLLELVRPYPALRAVLQRLEAAEKSSPSCGYPRLSCSPGSWCDRRRSPLSRLRDYQAATPSTSPLCQEFMRRSSPVHVQGDFRAPIINLSASAHASPLEEPSPKLNTSPNVRAAQATRLASPNTACRQGAPSNHSSRCGTPHGNQPPVEVVGSIFHNHSRCHTPRQANCLPPPPDSLCSARQRDSHSRSSKASKRANSVSLQASEPYQEHGDIKCWPLSNSFLYGRRGELMGSMVGVDRLATPRGHVSARPPIACDYESTQGRSRSLQASEPYRERVGSPSTHTQFVCSLRDGSVTPRVRTRSNSGSPRTSARNAVQHVSACTRTNGLIDIRRCSNESPRLFLRRPSLPPAISKESLDFDIKIPIRIQVG